MRKFSFQELAYAIVVASSYGLLMGYLFNNLEDLLMVLVWIVLVCAHLGGIITIVRLEESKKKKIKEEREKKI